MRHSLRLTALAVPVLAVSLLSVPSTLAVGGHAQPGKAAPPPARLVAPRTANAAAFTDVRRLPLITGDAVRVGTRADGSSVAALLDGGSFARWSTPWGSYVMPRSAAPGLGKVDLSLYDVTALAAAQTHGRIPVVVRFAPGADRALPGLRIGRTRSGVPAGNVHGSYGRGFAGLGHTALSRITSIRLDAPSTPTAVTQPADLPTHQVTVHVATKAGSGAEGAIVTLMNVEDADVFLGQEDTDATGVATFDNVPEGDYSVIVFTFSRAGRVLMDPEFAVSADQTVELKLSDATMKPDVAFPNHRLAEATYSVARWPEQGWAFPFSFSGPRFADRFQPVSDDVAHGWFYSGASATFTRGGTTMPHQVAVTSDVVRGVPAAFDVVHHRRDFARVVGRYHSNGPAMERPTYVMAADGRVDLSDFSNYGVFTPGVRVTLLQAGARAWYQQTFFPQAGEHSLNDLTQLITVDRYPHPGRHIVDWAQAPVGPGYEGGYQPRFGGAARDRNRLTVSLPLFEGAGAAMYSWVDRKDGGWTLRHRDHVLARGHHQIYRGVRPPPGDRRYVLTATSRPASHSWQLSTAVSDTWSFRSRSGETDVPILMPTYVATRDLANGIPPGPTSFPLSFHSTSGHVARIAHARVLLSTNAGHTWHPAGLSRRSPTSFQVHFRMPAAHGLATQALSIRVIGRDSHGNRVEETALRAYRLFLHVTPGAQQPQ